MSEHTVKVSFTGDAMCEAEQIKVYFEDGVFNFKSIFAELSYLLNKSDYVVSNLETPIAGIEKGYTKEKWSFNTPVEFAKELKGSGVDLVSTANNHCLDRGVEGAIQTIKELNKIGLEQTGLNSTHKSKKYIIKNIKGIKIGFLSYTYGTNAFSNNQYLNRNEKHVVNMFQEQEQSFILTKYAKQNPSFIGSKVYNRLIRYLNPKRFKKPVYERKECNLKQKNEIKENIKELRDKEVDYIIMLMHAGGQYNTEPLIETKKLVEFLSSLEIDIIIGNHEHIVHPFSNKHRTPVAYSLGNLTGYAGVYKEPYDKLAQYSILFHLYLSTSDKRIKKMTFSILKSIPDDELKVKTVPVYDLIQKTDDEKERSKLIKDNLFIYNKFLETRFEEIPIESEYLIK